MNSSPERLAHINPAREAVADAMMVAQYHLYGLDVGPKRTELKLASGTPQRLSDFQMRKTAGLCTEAASIVLTYLAHKTPNLFSSLVIVRGDSTDEHEIKNGWENHKIFIARDTQGIYFAGSPANYTERRNRLRELFSSRSVEKIMNHIKEEEGGTWPSAEEITNTMENHSLRFPKKKEVSDSRLTALLLKTEYRKELGTTIYRAIPFDLYDFENGNIVYIGADKSSPMAVVK